MTDADQEVADGITAAVQKAKDWADSGIKTLDESMSRNPAVGRTAKEVLRPLIGKDNYKEGATSVRGEPQFPRSQRATEWSLFSDRRE